MEFDIDSKLLIEFLEKVAMDEFNLTATPEGFVVQGMDTMQVVYNNHTLRKEAFTRYPSGLTGNDFPIYSKADLLAYLKRFSGKVHISITDYFVISTDKKLAKFPMAHKDNIAKVDPPKVSYDGFFTVKAAMMQEAMKNASVVKTATYTLCVKDKVFSVGVSNQDSELKEIEKVEYPDAECAYGAGFEQIFDNLDDDVSLAFKSGKPDMGYPLFVSQKNQVATHEYVVAPFRDTTTVPITKKEGEK